jgi:hypothetical protein
VRPVQRSHLIVAAAAVAAVLAAAALPATRGGDQARPAAARPAARAAVIGGATLQRARCSQWRSGTLAQQRAIIRALAASVGGPSGNARGTTLDEPQAFGLFDRACANPVARHFLLYELYIRAAAFRSLEAPAQ